MNELPEDPTALESKYLTCLLEFRQKALGLTLTNATEVVLRQEIEECKLICLDSK